MYIITATDVNEAYFIPSFVSALDMLKKLKSEKPDVSWLLASVLTGLEG